MAFFNPPFTNGVMVLEQAEQDVIKGKLVAIQEAFVPTDDEPSLTTHVLVSRYNVANVGNEINGDTCQAILAPLVEETGV